MPVIRHYGAGCYGNRVGFEVVIQRLGQAERLPVAGQVAVRHLSGCMHARVRPPRRGDRVGAILKPRQGRLDRALH